MTVMWLWGKSRNNYAVIDVGWGLVIAGIATIHLLFGGQNSNSKLILLGLVWIWAIRLSGYLYWTRIRTNHPEDKRYTSFRADYGQKVHQKFFTNVFLLQGFLAMLLSGPFWVAANVSGEGSFVFLGIILFLLGVLGEARSDQELHRFVKDSTNKGKVCDIGFWRYTRHPNYFFEFLLWLGIGCIPLQMNPVSWWSLTAPLLMFALLRFISGVPFAERQSMQSKPKAYAEYQRTTNAFFPWFPKSVK